MRMETVEAPAARAERTRRQHTRGLLDGGDWACSNGDGESLAEVARLLIADVPRDLQYELVAVAELARLDFLLASVRWAALSRQLRGA